MARGVSVCVAVFVLGFSLYFPATAQKYSEWSAPVNLGPTVNSPETDFGSAISKNGLSLYISSDRPGGSGSHDIWVSQRGSLEEPWGPPVNLGALINTGFDDYLPSFSRDGHWMFFASNRNPTSGFADIWVSWRTHTHDDFAWELPVRLGAEINSWSFEAAPQFFENEEAGTPVLFFSRWVPGSDLDTYVSTLACGGSYCPAVPVPELNSSARDARPNLRHDGREMFFYSNRPGGLGEMEDLWVSTRETTLDAWSTPMNVGRPVNTESRELHPALSSDRQTLFFASDRSGSLDLWMTSRTKGKKK